MITEKGFGGRHLQTLGPVVGDRHRMHFLQQTFRQDLRHLEIVFDDEDAFVHVSQSGGFLEMQPHRELELPWCSAACSRAVVHRSGDLAKTGAGEFSNRVAELRTIEDIESFGAEIETEPFGNREIFGESDVGLTEIRSSC